MLLIHGIAKQVCLSQNKHMYVYICCSDGQSEVAADVRLHQQAMTANDQLDGRRKIGQIGPRYGCTSAGLIQMVCFADQVDSNDGNCRSAGHYKVMAYTTKISTALTASGYSQCLLIAMHVLKTPQLLLIGKKWYNEYTELGLYRGFVRAHCGRARWVNFSE